MATDKQGMPCMQQVVSRSGGVELGLGIEALLINVWTYVGHCLHQEQDTACHAENKRQSLLDQI